MLWYIVQSIWFFEGIFSFLYWRILETYRRLWIFGNLRRVMLCFSLPWNRLMMTKIRSYSQLSSYVWGRWYLRRLCRVVHTKFLECRIICIGSRQTHVVGIHEFDSLDVNSHEYHNRRYSRIRSCPCQVPRAPYSMMITNAKWSTPVPMCSNAITLGCHNGIFYIVLPIRIQVQL